MGATLQEITALEYCGNGIVLAGSGNVNTADEGDVYRSTDFGQNWTKVEMGSIWRQFMHYVILGMESS